ncbi:MAG: VOC family protein [Pseudomarimonas sp.]
MNNPVCWFEIYVQDMARARQFYETVLAVSITPMAAGDLEMYAFPSNQEGRGASGSLVHVAGMPSGGNSTLVYFACMDCALEASRVVAAGGQLHRNKFSIGEYGYCALALDTEGNMFGLYSMK